MGFCVSNQFVLSYRGQVGPIRSRKYRTTHVARLFAAYKSDSCFLRASVKNIEHVGISKHSGVFLFRGGGSGTSSNLQLNGFRVVRCRLSSRRELRLRRGFRHSLRSKSRQQKAKRCLESRADSESHSARCLAIGDVGNLFPACSNVQVVPFHLIFKGTVVQMEQWSFT